MAVGGPEDRKDGGLAGITRVFNQGRSGDIMQTDIDAL